VTLTIDSATSTDTAKRYKPSKLYPVQRKRTQRRYELLGKYKTNKGCVVCGYNKHPKALCFDHIDPGQKSLFLKRKNRYPGSGSGIGALLKRICIKDMEKNHYYIKVLFDELRKCQIMCHNCHQIKTFENKDHMIWRKKNLK
jgi:hypothetical protein